MNDGLNADLLGSASSWNLGVLGHNLDFLATLDQSLKDRDLGRDHLSGLLVVDLHNDCFEARSQQRENRLIKPPNNSLSCLSSGVFPLVGRP